MEFTKGPWKLHPYNARMGSLVSFGDISKGEIIAAVYAQRDPLEGQANARLLAAAPDLLDALKALMPEGWGDEDTMDHMPGIKLARAAISKATRTS